MYKYSNGQISLTDFRQPVGMHLKEGNRWVKKAQAIPWLEIEKRYAALLTNRKGNVAKPLRLALDLGRIPCALLWLLTFRCYGWPRRKRRLCSADINYRSSFGKFFEIWV